MEDTNINTQNIDNAPDGGKGNNANNGGQPPKKVYKDQNGNVLKNMDIVRSFIGTSQNDGKQYTIGEFSEMMHDVSSINSNFYATMDDSEDYYLNIMRQYYGLTDNSHDEELKLQLNALNLIANSYNSYKVKDGEEIYKQVYGVDRFPSTYKTLYGREQTIPITGSYGPASSQTMAIQSNKTMLQDGTVVDGLPWVIGEDGNVSLTPTQVVQDPIHGPVMKMIEPGFVNTSKGQLVKPFSSGKYALVKDNVWDDMIKAGTLVANDDGVTGTMRSSTGMWVPVTKNRAIGGGTEFSGAEYEEAIKKNYNVDVNSTTNIYTADGKVIEDVKVEKAQRLIQDRYNFAEWYSRGVGQSINNSLNTFGIIFRGVDNENVQQSYYRNRVNDITRPEAITTAGGFWDRSSMATMMADFTVQLVPTIALSLVTRGVGGAALQGGVKVAEGTAEYLAKRGVSSVIKKNIWKQTIAPNLIKGLEIASWAPTAATQSAYGMYSQAINSGVDPEHARVMSVAMGAATLLISAKLSPSFTKLPSRMYKMNNKVANAFIDATRKEMGLSEMMTASGSSRGVFKIIDKYNKFIEEPGVAPFVIEWLGSSGIEGAEEVVENVASIGIAATYNSMYGWNKAPGEGRMDTKSMWEGTWQEAAGGFLMGGLGHVIHPGTYMHAAQKKAQNDKKANDTRAYQTFFDKGVDKGLSEITSKASAIHEQGGFGRNNVDIEGNAIIEGTTAKSITIEDPNIAKEFKDGKIVTENDYNYYNFLIDVHKQADIYNAAVSAIGVDKLTPEMINNFDVSPNIAVSGALAYKELYDKKNTLKELEQAITEEKDDKKKEVMQKQIDTLKGSVTDKGSIAYSQERFDYYSKPLKDTTVNDEVSEIDQNRYYGEDVAKDELLKSLNIGGVKTYMYNYSQAVRDHMVLSQVVKKSIELNGAMFNGGTILVGDELSKGVVYDFIASPTSIFDNISKVHSYFGSMSPTGRYTNGKNAYSGLGKVITEINNRYSRFAPFKTVLDKVNDKGVSDAFSGINAILKEFKGGNVKAEQLPILSKHLETLKGAKLSSSEMETIMKGMKAKDLKPILDVIDMSRDALDDLSYLEKMDLDNIIYDEDGNINEEVVGNISSITSIAKSLTGSYDEILSMQDMVLSDNVIVDGKTLEDPKNADSPIIKNIANTMLKQLYGDVVIDDIVDDPKTIPSALRGKGMTINDILSWAEDMSETATDPVSLSALSWAIDEIQKWMNKNIVYLETLSVMKENEEKNKSFASHNYLNNITRVYEQEKTNIRDTYNEMYEDVKKIHEDLVKKGFTRDKANNQVLYATVANNDTYIAELNREYFSKIHALFMKGDEVEFPTAEKADDYVLKYIYNKIKDRYKTKKEQEDFAKEWDKNYKEIAKAMTEYSQAKDKILKDTAEACGIDMSQVEDNAVNGPVTFEFEFKALYSLLFGDDAAMLEKNKDTLIHALNLLNAEQWKMRSVLSGKLELPLLMMEAIQELSGADYYSISEYSDDKKLEERIETDENGITYTALRGSMSPLDMSLGFDYINNISRVDHAREAEMALPEDATEEQRNNIRTQKTKIRNIEAKKWLANNPRYKGTKDTALHFLITNMRIDNILGQETTTIAEIYKAISQIEVDMTIDDSAFTAEEKTMLSKAFVYNEDKQQFDIDATMKNLKALIANDGKKGETQFMEKANILFNGIRKNITVEQENAIIQMMANLYYCKSNNFSLGLYSDNHRVPMKNAISILGEAGTGKTTVVLNTYLRLLKGKMKDNEKVRINTLVPTAALAHTHKATLADVFTNAGTLNNNSNEVVFDEGTATLRTFNEAKGNISLDGDILIIDEASLISSGHGRMNEDGSYNADIKMWENMSPIIYKALKDNPNMQILVLYDNNQTTNGGPMSEPVSRFLGERTSPLQIKYRTGELNVHKLSTFFSSTAFQGHKGDKDSPLPLLNNNGALLSLEQAISPDGKVKGVKIHNAIDNVIRDYQNDTDTDKMLVVLDEEEADRVSSVYNIPKDKIHVIMYEDSLFSSKNNISGLSAANIYIAVDPLSYITKEEYTPYAYLSLGRMLNTALTRRRGDGLLSMVYPNADNNIKEVKSISSYNDHLIFELGFHTDSDYVYKIFSEYGVPAMTTKNYGLDRRSVVAPVKRSKAEGTTVKEEEGTTVKGEGDPIFRSTDPYDVGEANIKKFKDSFEKETKKGVNVKEYLFYNHKKALNLKENEQSHKWNTVLRKGIEYFFNLYAKDISNNIDMNLDDAFQSYLEGFKSYIERDGDVRYEDCVKAFSPELEYHLAEERFNEAVKTSLLRMIEASGISNYAVKQDRAIITPPLSLNIQEKGISTTVDVTPLMITLEGVDVSGNMIVDVYMSQFDALKENKDKLSDYENAQMALTVAALGQKGFKVNRIHSLRYKKGHGIKYNPDAMGGQETIKTPTTSLEQSIDYSLEDLIEGYTSLLKSLGIITDTQIKDSVATVEDILNTPRIIQMGEDDDVRFTNEKGDTLYVKAKIRKDNKIYYVGSDNVMYSPNAITLIEKRGIRLFNAIDSQVPGTFFVDDKSIPDVLNANTVKSSVYESGYIKSKPVLHDIIADNNLSYVEVSYVPEQDRTLVADGVQRVTYKNAIRYTISENDFNAFTANQKNELGKYFNLTENSSYIEFKNTGALDIGFLEAVDAGYDKSHRIERMKVVNTIIDKYISDSITDQEMEDELSSLLRGYYEKDFKERNGDTLVDKYLDSNIEYQIKKVRAIKAIKKAQDGGDKVSSSINGRKRYGSVITGKEQREGLEPIMSHLLGDNFILDKDDKKKIRSEKADGSSYFVFSYTGNSTVPVELTFNIAKADTEYLNAMSMEIEELRDYLKELKEGEGMSKETVRKMRDKIESSEVYDFLNANIGRLSSNLRFTRKAKDEEGKDEQVFVRNRFTNYSLLLEMYAAEVAKAKRETQTKNLNNNYNKAIYNKDKEIYHGHFVSMAEKFSNPSYFVDENVRTDNNISNNDNPDVILPIGSKQDIEGFRRFVNTTNNISNGVDSIFETVPELGLIGTKKQYSQYLDSKNRLYRSETSLRVDETKAPDWLKEQPEIIAQQEAQGRWFYRSLKEAQEHSIKFEGDKITYIDVDGDIEQYNAKDNKFAGGYGRAGREYFVSKELAKNRIELGSKQDIEGFKDFVSKPIFDKELAQKIQDKLEKLYPEIKLNISNNPVWEKGDNVFNQEEYNNQVNYRLKATEILLSDKAKQVFEKGKKNNWSLDKILTELAIPKEQKQLILDLGITDREQIALELASSYSYSIEINTAKDRKVFDTGGGRLADFTLNNIRYTTSSEGEYGKYVNNEFQEITVDEYQEAFDLYNDKSAPTQYYSNLTVSGGTNYTENEISTPLITPSIKGHAQFSTDKGIGWFRSDEQQNTTGKGDLIQDGFNDDGTPYMIEASDDYIPVKTKTRRILEIQSDLFQKGRDKNKLAGIGEDESFLKPIKGTEDETGIPDFEKDVDLINQNQFLQLLNKDNNWVTFFIKSIIQDSAKKGYEKVLFPKGETAAKVEGHETLATRINKFKDNIVKLNDAKLNPEKYKILEGGIDEETGKNYMYETYNVDLSEGSGSYSSSDKKDFIKGIDKQIDIEEQNIQNLKSQGIEKLKPIEAFYEIKVGNILDKQFGKDNVKTITDEYGNEWREITINQARDLKDILLQRNEANQIIGQANIKAMTVLIDAINQKQDTIPHEYAHHYIAWFRNTPIVQEGIKKWGSEEALVQSIGEQVVKQKGEAYNWWNNFVKWIKNQFNSLSKLQKEELTQILTDAFLTRQDLGSKQDIEGFKEFVNKPNLNQISNKTEIKPEIQDNGPDNDSGLEKRSTSNISDDYDNGETNASARQEVARLLGASNNIHVITLSNNLTNSVVYGKYSNAMITLFSKDGKVAKNTVRHESMHFICDMMLTREEYKEVLNAANNILLRQNKKVTSERDGLEYIAERFETVSKKPETWLGTVLYKFIHGLRQIFYLFNKNKRILDNLFYNAEMGVYAKRGMIYAKGNGNIDLETTLYKSVENDYTTTDSILELNTVFNNEHNIIRARRNIIRNTVSDIGSYGRLVTKDKTSDSAVVYDLYNRLRDENRFNEIGKLPLHVKGGEDITVKDYLSDTASNSVGENLSKLKQAILNGEIDISSDNNIAFISKFKNENSNGDFTKVAVRDAIFNLCVDWVIMDEAITNKNLSPLHTLLQSSVPSINIKDIINVYDEQDRDNEQESTSDAIDKAVPNAYTTSFAENKSFDNVCSDTMKEMIENITVNYVVGRNNNMPIEEVRHISWKQYSNMLSDIIWNYSLGNAEVDAPTDRERLWYELYKDRKFRPFTFYNIMNEIKAYGENSKEQSVQLMCQAIYSKFGDSQRAKDGYYNRINREEAAVVLSQLKGTKEGKFSDVIYLPNNIQEAVAFINAITNKNTDLGREFLSLYNNNIKDSKPLIDALIKRKHAYLNMIVAMNNDMKSIRPNKVIKGALWGKKATITELTPSGNLNAKVRANRFAEIALLDIGSTVDGQYDPKTTVYSKSSVIAEMKKVVMLKYANIDKPSDKVENKIKGTDLLFSIGDVERGNISNIYKSMAEEIRNNKVLSKELSTLNEEMDAVLTSLLEINMPGYFNKELISKLPNVEKENIFNYFGIMFAADDYNQKMSERESDKPITKEEAMLRRNIGQRLRKDDSIKEIKINNISYISSVYSAGISFIISKYAMLNSSGSYFTKKGNNIAKNITHTAQSKIGAYGTYNIQNQFTDLVIEYKNIAFDKDGKKKDVLPPRIADLEGNVIFSRDVSRDDVRVLNPLLSNYLTEYSDEEERTSSLWLGNMSSINEFDSFGSVKDFNDMTRKDRLKVYFKHILPTFTSMEDARYNVLISHAGDRSNTYCIDMYKNPFFSQYFHKINTPNKGVIGNAVALLVEYNANMYQDHESRLGALKRANKIDLNSKDEFIFNKKAIMVGSIEGDIIQNELRENYDYRIKGGVFVKGNAGTDPLFGYNAWAKTKTVDGVETRAIERVNADNVVSTYYEQFNKYVDENIEEFYDMMKSIQNGSNVLTDNEKAYYRKYYITHLLINESFSYLTRGTIEEYKDMKDFVKRGMGPTAPIHSFNTDESLDSRPGIGRKTNFVIVEDLPMIDPLFDEEGSLNGATDGLAIHPLFYRNALKNSAGADLGFIGEGAIKTIHFEKDFMYGKLHYMKSSEMAVDQMLYDTAIGRGVYKMLLDKEIEVKNADGTIGIVNPYVKFLELLRDNKSTKKINSFQKANNDLLKWLWETKLLDGTRLFNAVGHKVIFHSASKSGTTGITKYQGINIMQSQDGKTEGYEYNNITFPSLRTIKLQSVGNENYGLQNNKRHSTEAQKKNIMSQFIRLLGAYKVNKDLYKNLTEARANYILAMEEKLSNALKKENKFDREAILSYYGNIVKSNRIHQGETLTVLNNIIQSGNSLKEIKKDIMIEIIKGFNDTAKSKSLGGIFVQQPLLMFKDINGTERQLSTFGYEKDGKRYTSKETLLSDIKAGADIKVVLQEGVMAFPFTSDFKLSKHTSLKDVMMLGEKSLYLTNKDYTWDSKRQELVPTKEKIKEIKDTISSHFKGREGGKSMDRVTAEAFLEGVHKDAKYAMLGSKKKERTYSSKEIIDDLITYYTDLNNALNIYALRIPTTDASCGFPTRIAAFDYSVENVIFTNPAKSLLDGSDYDIDELNLFYRSARPSLIKEKRKADSDFTDSFYHSIMGYYMNPENAKSVLSSITTKNLVRQSEESDMRRDNTRSQARANTITHQMDNQIMNQESKKLVGYMVNIGIDFANIMSIMNNVKSIAKEGGWINRLGVFTNEDIKTTFFSVTSELTNGATDNANIGGALSNIGVNSYSSSLVAGLCLNMDNAVIYNHLLKGYIKTINDGLQLENKAIRTEQKLTDEFNDRYGIVLDNDGNITSIDSKYVFMMLDIILNSPSVVNAVNKARNTDTIFGRVRKSKIYEDGDIGEEGGDTLIEVLHNAMYQGEGLRRFGRIDVDEIKNSPVEVDNMIREIASYLGIIENKDNNVILALESFLNSGDASFDRPFSDISYRYGTSSSLEKGVYDNFNLRYIVLNDEAIKQKLLSLINKYKALNASSKTQELSYKISDVVSRKTNSVNLYKDEYESIDREVDRLDVGHSIEKLSDEYAIVTIDGTSYDMRTAKGRHTFMGNFASILSHIKSIYQKSNMFINYIKPSVLSDYSLLYGIESAMFLTPQLKADLISSIQPIYQAAIRTNNLSNEKEIETATAKEVMKALEYVTLLTYGYRGGRDSMLELLPRYIRAEMDNNIDIKNVVDDKIDSFIKAIDRDGMSNPDLVYLLRGKSPIKGLKESDSIDNEVLYKDRSEIEEEDDYSMYETNAYTTGYQGSDMTVLRKISGRETISTAFVTSPYNTKVNMYGVNSRVSPIVVNVPTLNVPSKYLKQVIAGDNTIEIDKDSVYKMRGDDVNHIIDIKKAEEVGYGVNIFGEAYTLTATPTDYKQDSSDPNMKIGVRPTITLTKMVDEKGKEYKALSTYNGLEFSSLAIDKRRLGVFIDRINKVFPNVVIKTARLGGSAELANVSNGQVILNLDRISPSSTIHELAHVFTMIIKDVNIDLYNQLRSEAMWHIDNRSELYEAIIKEYNGVSLNTEDTVMEIIGNLVQMSYGKAMDAFFISNDVSMETQGKIKDSTSKQGVIGRFLSKIGNLLAKIFGLNRAKINSVFDVENKKTMTISEMGQMLYDAIIQGEALSYVTTEELALMSDGILYSLHNTKIKDSQDFINNYLDQNSPFANMNDKEKVDAMYSLARQNKGAIAWGDIYLDISTMDEATAKKNIIEYILPNYQVNMGEFKDKLVNTLTAMKGDINYEFLGKGLGIDPSTDTPMYVASAIDSLARIIGYESNKKYVKLSSLTKDNTILAEGKFKSIFKGLKGLEGFDPVISIEHEKEGQMVVSIYDFVSNDVNATSGYGVPKHNLLLDYGVSDQEASGRGFTLDNSNMNMRALMITLIANKLQRKGNDIIVRDMSVVKVKKMTQEKPVVRYFINPYEITSNIAFMGKNKEFLASIENEDMLDLFLTNESDIKVNNINYFDMLYSHYRNNNYMKKEYGVVNDKYDSFLRNKEENLKDGSLTMEDKIVLIRWRMNILSNIPTESMTITNYNELKMLHDAYLQMRDGAFDCTQVDSKKNIDLLNKFSAQMDIRSEEVQTLRRSMIEAQNKTLYETRKIADSTAHIWRHFDKERRDIKGVVVDPFYIYESLHATIPVKDSDGNIKQANIGRVLWTTDESLDKEFYAQAKEKIAKRELTQEDLDKMSTMCDKIEDIYVMMLKHQHMQKYGTPKVFTKEEGYHDVTDDYWKKELKKRGYIKGMIPIVPKDYVDSISSIAKKVGLDIKENTNEFAIMEDTSNELSSDKLIDEISNIFLNQISGSSRNLDVQLNPANIGSFIHPKYGTKTRFNYLGLQSDAITGEMFFVANTGENKNNNINKNLEKIFEVFNLAMTRKAIYEQDVVPVANTLYKLSEYGEVFEANTDAVVLRDVLSALIQMGVEGKSKKIKNFGKFSDTKPSLGELISVGINTTVAFQMVGNINVGLQSFAINNYRLAIEALVGSGKDTESFIGGVANNMKASNYVYGNLGKAFNLAYDFHIIQNSERAILERGYKGLKSDKTFFTKFLAGVFNWGTDSKTRTNVLFAKMMKDGSLNAITFNKDGWIYDDTKDARFYKEDGTQTQQQKALLAKMIENHRRLGIDVFRDAHGIDHLTQPYDWEECNAIKEFADKRLIGSYDTTTKTIMGVETLGKLAVMYFNWFMVAADNMFGRKHTVETVFEYKVDVDDNVYKDKMISEGFMRTMVRIFQEAYKTRDLSRIFRADNQWERQNKRRFLYTAALIILGKVLYSLFTIDDEDDEIGIISGKNRFVKNFDYATSSLFLLGDIFQRMKTPFPLLDMIGSIYDEKNGGVNVKATTRLLPMYSTVKGFVDIFDDK